MAVLRRWLPRVAGALAYLLLGALLLAAAALLWLSWDAHRDHDDALVARHGELLSAALEPLAAAPGLAAERVRLGSDSGLAVTVRVLRPRDAEGPLPVLVLLGGHRTGSDAVTLFDDIGERAVVALDYPYDGKLTTDGVLESLAALAPIRRAFFDATPAIWLTVDWLAAQPWADRERIVMIGVSLGVPFAATAAARDERIAALMLVHGAADNRAWIAKNLDRRVQLGPFKSPTASVLNWVVYGPLHDTAAHVAEMAPRRVLIVGARADERVPEGAAEALYEAAQEPKTLRYTSGRHVRPGREDVIDELLGIADAEL